MRAVQFGGGQDHDELLASKAADNIFSANAPAQKRCRLAQHGVAGIVSVGVVEFLEVVEIKHEDSQGLLGAHGAADFAIESLFQIAAVVKSSERIADGLRAQRFAQANVGD